MKKYTTPWNKVLDTLSNEKNRKMLYDLSTWLYYRNETSIEIKPMNWFHIDLDICEKEECIDVINSIFNHDFNTDDDYYYYDKKEKRFYSIDDLFDFMLNDMIFIFYHDLDFDSIDKTINLLHGWNRNLYELVKRYKKEQYGND